MRAAGPCAGMSACLLGCLQPCHRPPAPAAVHAPMVPASISLWRPWHSCGLPAKAVGSKRADAIWAPLPAVSSAAEHLCMPAGRCPACSTSSSVTWTARWRAGSVGQHLLRAPWETTMEMCTLVRSIQHVRPCPAGWGQAQCLTAAAARLSQGLLPAEPCAPGRVQHASEPGSCPSS